MVRLLGMVVTYAGQQVDMLTDADPGQRGAGERACAVAFSGESGSGDCHRENER